LLNKHFSTHAICLTGALVFLWLKLPLPWLFGPLASCLIAALFGAQLYSVKILSDSMRTILGVAAGSTVTVTFITAIPSLWSTLILIPIMVILIGFMGVWYFQKLCGYDFPELDRPPGKLLRFIDINQLIILGVCAFAGWKIASSIGMFGATILGPLILTAAASMTGILNSRPPAEAIWAAQYFISLLHFITFADPGCSWFGSEI